VAASDTRVRTPDLSGVYKFRREDLTLDEFSFALTLIRGDGPAVKLDRGTTELQWTDDQTGMTGTLTVQRPDPERFESLPILRGYRVRCEVAWASRTYRLWEMVCREPTTEKETGVVNVPLEDDLVVLRRNRRDWSFRRTKARKKGYFPHEIALEVCRREGIRPGSIARGTYRLDKLVRKDASAVDVLKAAYAQEREKTGRRFVIRMRNGRLDVVPYRRNVLLYTLKDQLQAATLENTEPTGTLVTVVEAKGRIGKGKDARKVRQVIYDRDVVRRFGYLHVEKDYGRVDSLADLREKAQRFLAGRIGTRQAGTLTTSGIPFISRGDMIRWVTTEPGWHGPSFRTKDRSFVYVTGVSHDVSPDGYTSDVTVAQADPYTKDKERLDKEARERARKKRKGK
jgi:hypothetical protein